MAFSVLGTAQPRKGINVATVKMDEGSKDVAVRAAGRTQVEGKRSSARALIFGIILTIALVVVSLFVGVYDVVGGEDGWQMFFITRVPRTIALIFAGAAMSICGLVMQLMTQNRFVEPSTTGTTEWAGLGLLTTMIVFPGSPIIVRMLGAILFAFFGTIIFFLFLRRVTLKSLSLIHI